MFHRIQDGIIDGWNPEVICHCSSLSWNPWLLQQAGLISFGMALAMSGVSQKACVMVPTKILVMEESITLIAKGCPHLFSRKLPRSQGSCLGFGGWGLRALTSKS